MALKVRGAGLGVRLTLCYLKLLRFFKLVRFFSVFISF